MSISDRFKQVMEREKLPAGAFAESIGVAPATISHILSGRNKNPSTEVIMRLRNRYPDINWEWLMTGEGPMSNNPDYTPHATTPAPYNGTDEDSLFPLFAENAVNPTNGANKKENRKEMALEIGEKGIKEIVKQEIKYIERPARKITEIRIFFDDNTYETFRPA